MLSHVSFSFLANIWGRSLNVRLMDNPQTSTQRPGPWPVIAFASHRLRCHSCCLAYFPPTAEPLTIYFVFLLYGPAEVRMSVTAARFIAAERKLTITASCVIISARFLCECVARFVRFAFCALVAIATVPKRKTNK